MLMGDEKETWKVKTLDEILQEKKRRRELEEKTDTKRQKNFSKSVAPQANDREPKRDTPEEGELRDQRMEITIRNSPYVREDSTEDRRRRRVTSNQAPTAGSAEGQVPSQEGGEEKG